MDINRTIVSGRLLEAPFYTVRSTGNPITIINLAVHESETRFEQIKVIAFGEDAAAARDGLAYNDRIIVEGRLVAVDRGKKGCEVYADQITKTHSTGNLTPIL